MSKILGRVAGFGIAKETVRGTPESAATYWVPFESADVNEKYENVVDEQSRGVIEASVGESRLKEWAEAVIKAPIGDAHIGLILLSLFGTDTVTDNPDSNAAVKDHTFSIAQSAQHQALSLFVDDPAAAADYKHGLGMIESLEINYEQGKFITYSVTFKAKKGASATNTPSYTAENRFLPQHVTFKLAATQAGLDGASASVIRSFNIKFNPNLEGDWSLGSVAPTDWLNKQFQIEGDIEAIWNSEADYKTAALAGTQKALRMALTNTDVVIGAAANPLLQIDLHKVLFTEITRPFATNDFIIQTLGFRAHYNVTDSKMITTKLTNIVSGY